jgi:hypothetical protein
MFTSERMVFSEQSGVEGIGGINMLQKVDRLLPVFIFPPSIKQF